jgi:trimeric autotransporter adhesin
MFSRALHPARSALRFAVLTLAVALPVTAVVAVTTELAGATAATSGTWGSPTEVLGSGGGGGYFNGVSCTAAGDCTAVGQDANSQPVYATESAGTWGSPTEIAGSGFGSYFNGVSCTAEGDCTAVGQDANGQPIYATESAGTWGSPTEIAGSGLGSYFTGVSCTAAGDCTAVGEDQNLQPIYATESAGTWGSAIEVPGSGGGDGYFTGVSCTAAGYCTAVGQDANGQPIYATESAGAWGSPTEVPGSGGDADFNGVSCIAVGYCTAAGEYNLNGQLIYATESAGIWGSPTEVPGSGGGRGFFNGVSCTAAFDCTAVGDDANGQPIYVTELANPSVSITNLPTSATYGGSFTPNYSTSGDGTSFSVTSNSTGVCTVLGSMVNFVGVGVCSLTPSVAATTDYAQATGSAQSFTVSPTTPTVAIANIPTSATYGGSFTPTYTTSGDGTSFSVTSNSTSICSINGSIVGYVGVGTCSLTASVAATTGYTAATETQTFGIGPAPLIITASSPTMYYGAPVPAITSNYATFVNGDSASTLASVPNQPPVCTTAATSSSRAGSSYPTSCSGAIDADYTISYVTGKLSVTKAPTSLTASPANLRIGLLRESVTMSATLVSNATNGAMSGQKVTFTLGKDGSCTAVTNAHGVANCSVTMGALLNLLGPPVPSTYTASYAGTSNYLASSATGTVKQEGR